MKVTVLFHTSLPMQVAVIAGKACCELEKVAGFLAGGRII